MNKRIISMLLALVMVLSLTACGKKTTTGSKTDGEQITLTLGVNGKANVTEWDNNKLVYSQEETDLMGTAKVDILTYAKEMRAKFISGEIDIDDDAQWQKYVDNIHKLGWDNAIAASQAAWDRMNGN